MFRWEVPGPFYRYGRRNKARLNMEKCAEFLARMIQKYGDVVLGEIEERNAQLQGK